MSSSTQPGSQIIHARVKMRLALTAQPVEERWAARAISSADIPALGQLMLAAYRGTIDDEGETLEDAIREVQHTFAGAVGPLLEGCSLVIEEDGQALGCILVTLWQKNQRPLVALVMTHPSAKNRGMARFLLQKSINALLAQGYDEVYLYVTVGNLPAQHLYERLGFQLMATVSETGFAKVNGVRLYYEVAGEGQPVVLVHSGLADSRMWDGLFRALARQYRVIRYDLRGFGRSGMPPGPYSARDDLAALLRHLGVEKAVLIGSSYGGQIATDFTLEHPEMVVALIPVGAGISGEQLSEVLHARWAEIGSAMEADDIAQAVELELRLWVDGPGRSPEQVNPAVRELVREMNTNNIRREPEQAQGQPQPLQPPALGRLGEIRVPTLVLVGGDDVPDMLASADTLAQGIAGAKKVVMPGTAHLPSLEQPDEFNRLVLEFLGGLRGS